MPNGAGSFQVAGGCIALVIWIVGFFARGSSGGRWYRW
jgi:hypothetical protein